MRTTLLTACLILVACEISACSSDEAVDAGVDAGDPRSCDGKDAGEACGEGLCFSSGDCDAEMLCYPGCEQVGASCSNGTCYMIGHGKFNCAPTGTKTAGDSCGGSDRCNPDQIECAAGVQCLELGGVMNCYEVCIDTCDAGECVDTELGFSVCMATEGP